MPITQAQVSEITRKFASALFDSAVKTYQLAYKTFQPTKVPFSFMQSALTNAGITAPAIQLDDSYFVTEWNQWEIIKDTTIIDKLIYYAEYFDCDNFSYLFSSLSALLFKLNSCGATYGAVYNDATKELIAYHYFNTIITSDGSAYCYEPMNDNWVKIEKDKPIVMGGWEYKILKIYYY